MSNTPFYGELSQRQLRELIAKMMGISSLSWNYEPCCCPPTMPAWVETHWNELRTDPVGVIQWAVQYLEV